MYYMKVPRKSARVESQRVQCKGSSSKLLQQFNMCRAVSVKHGNPKKNPIIMGTSPNFGRADFSRSHAQDIINVEQGNAKGCT